MKMNDRGEITIKKLLAVAITVIVGLIMLPTIQDAVTSGQEWNNNSTDETTSSLLDMITLFYVLLIVLGAVIWIVYETRGMGN